MVRRLDATGGGGRGRRRSDPNSWERAMTVACRGSAFPLADCAIFRSRSRWNLRSCLTSASWTVRMDEPRVRASAHGDEFRSLPLPAVAERYPYDGMIECWRMAHVESHQRVRDPPRSIRCASSMFIEVTVVYTARVRFGIVSELPNAGRSGESCWSTTPEGVQTVAFHFGVRSNSRLHRASGKPYLAWKELGPSCRELTHRHVISRLRREISQQSTGVLPCEISPRAGRVEMTMGWFSARELRPCEMRSGLPGQVIDAGMISAPSQAPVPPYI